MGRIKLKYAYCIPSRHGRERWYFWRGKGHPRVRLEGEPRSAAFMATYNALLKGEAPAKAQEEPDDEPAAPGGTLQWLCNAYLASPEFGEGAETTQASKRSIIKMICAERINPTSAKCFGDLPFAQVTSKAVRVIRDNAAKAKGATTANNRLSVLKTLYKWAIEAEHFCGINPVLSVPKIKHRSGGHHTWTIEEIRQYEARHPIGTQARLALALLVYTGQRRSDIVQMGRQHITRQGWLKFVQVKNRAKNPVTVEFPMLPQLVAVIEASPVGDMTWLVNHYGKPLSVDNFGDRFRIWCNEAGLPHCTAHGIRKAAACAAAEGGATDEQMMAIFGWRKADMARVYTQAANRARMAGLAMHLLSERPDGAGTNLYHLENMRSKSGKETGK